MILPLSVLGERFPLIRTSQLPPPWTSEVHAPPMYLYNAHAECELSGASSISYSWGMVSINTDLPASTSDPPAPFFLFVCFVSDQ